LLDSSNEDIIVARQEYILTVFVASPSDVASERAQLERIIAELNQTWSRSLGIRLDLVRWETHAHPGFGVDAQDVINRQVPDDYDIFIGIMWHRFGTPTGRAESGSHEEFLRAKARWDQDKSSICLMLYFKNAPIAPSEVEVSQLGQVKAFQNSVPNDGGLYWMFQSTDEFVNLARIHLTRVVQEWQNKLPKAAEIQSRAQLSVGQVGEIQPQEYDSDIGLFELNEQIESSFTQATDVLTRITKSIESIGRKTLGHGKRLDTAIRLKPPTRAVAKRMIGRFAADMTEFAVKLDQDVPLLGAVMNRGLGALSQAISFWPDSFRDQDKREQVTTWVRDVQSLRSVSSASENDMNFFRNTVGSLPPLTSELNKAKRSVSAALERVIFLLQTQQKVLTQIEKSATEVINAQRLMAEHESEADFGGL
jgi:Domain of unknown function (DUF4062)